MGRGNITTHVSNVYTRPLAYSSSSEGIFMNIVTQRDAASHHDNYV